MSPPRSHWRAVGLVCTILIAGGIGYRALAWQLDHARGGPLDLPRPLASIPLEIGRWIGEDVPLPKTIARVAGNDAWVSRRYRDRATGDTVMFYLGFTARPRTMLGHRPGICYPSAGWIPERADVLDLVTPDGPLPCQVHVFSPPNLRQARQMVVNYYVVAGHVTRDESMFRGLSWRDPNLRRDARRYVAQVQITVALTAGAPAAEALAERFAMQITPAVLAVLPDGAAADEEQP